MTGEPEPAVAPSDDSEPRQLSLDDELPEHDGLTFDQWIRSLPTRLEEAA